MPKVAAASEHEQDQGGPLWCTRSALVGRLNVQWQGKMLEEVEEYMDLLIKVLNATN